MFIKDALAELEPVYIAGYRILLGAVTLLIFLAARRLRLPSGTRLWVHLFVYAIVGVGLIAAAPRRRDG